MKKLVSSLFALLLLASTSFAQDAASAYKAGSKAFNKWKTETDAEKKKALLDEAASNMDVATAGASALTGKTLSKMLIAAGQVYNEYANMEVIAKSLNPKGKLERPDAALKAFAALKKTIEVSEKKYFKSDAFGYLRATSSHMSNIGLLSFQDGNYANAFTNYKSVSELHDLFLANKKKAVLDDESKMNDHTYMLALSALQDKKMDEAESNFTKLKEGGYAEAAVYNALVTIAMDKKETEKAEALLAEGRQKFPEDNSLMVTELNHYLTSNRFDELVDKLEAAIAADPENVSYYSALGNTYDNLFQKEMADKNLAKADEYFSKAMDYYGQALEKDENYFFAIYNTGVLYVNKANLLIEELKVLEDKGDYSKAALAAMEDKKAAINAEFEKSLPLFQRAEKLNPNDVNTLSALKEIYARKEDFEVSKIFGERMKVVQSGGENTSYFEGK